MSTHTNSSNRIAPVINLTPLIDVLLVLLIIFMVVTPARPSRFKAQIPEPLQKEIKGTPDERMLVVAIEKDGAVQLNREAVGTLNDLALLGTRLKEVFAQRTANRAFDYKFTDRADLPDAARIPRTVFIRAPRAFAYGEVAKVIDTVKDAGGNIGLQVDALE